MCGFRGPRAANIPNIVSPSNIPKKKGTSIFDILRCPRPKGHTHNRTYYSILNIPKREGRVCSLFLWFASRRATKKYRKHASRLKCRKRKGRRVSAIVCGLRGRRAATNTGKRLPSQNTEKEREDCFFIFAVAESEGHQAIPDIVSPSKIPKRKGLL